MKYMFDFNFLKFFPENLEKNIYSKKKSRNRTGVLELDIFCILYTKEVKREGREKKEKEAIIR